jgi:glutathione synthase/RimK-type ligase-like ATP-grasp enzyme
VDVILVTASDLPRPDADAEPLEAAVRARGLRAATRAWDDPSVEWGGARVCVIRSTWNYVRHYPRFLAWAEDCARASRLENPLSVVRWNSHKRYMVELGARGLPVVPTRIVTTGDAVDLGALMAEWGELVIKPAVSVGSIDTIRAGRDRLDEARRHLDALVARGEALVQPYYRSVEEYGERCLIWIAGAFTHAVRKGARFAADAERVSDAVPIATDERVAAEQLLAAAPAPVLYARVDLARDDDGRPRLMELELVEPCLFLDRAPAARERLADAIAEIAR